jgi:DMSO/TMAO reductase YedYZ molybdopterin-dependent catalytic subunit
MDQQEVEVPRRTVLKGGVAAGLSGLTVLSVAGPAQAFPGHAGNGVVIPWLDQPAPIPPPFADTVGNLLRWESLDSRLIPNDEFFHVRHYDLPRLSGVDWRLRIHGLVARPLTLSLAQLKALPRRSVEFTLECSGNTGAPFFIGGIGNAVWAGAPVHRLLRQARPLDRGIEVVFWAADRGTVTIRDNTGVTGPGRTGTVEPDSTGGLDLTITEQFARSMSLEDAMDADNLLCYEMNGAPLPPEHGYPVRLIAPGWYGVANVKWLTRIEVIDSRFQGRFMARDYVTIREEERGGDTVWTFTSVTHDRLKSAPAKVIRRGERYTVMGAAWGAPIARVEVQIDGGRWRVAKLDRQRRRFAWRFWTLDWGTPPPGEHTVTSRAFDEDGNVQPSPQDASVAGRRTYWENNGQITRRVRIP